MASGERHSARGLRGGVSKEGAEAGDEVGKRGGLKPAYQAAKDSRPLPLA